MSLRLSVVVPTYKRPDLLERCLLKLLAQNLAPHEYEIIVADDGPTKETEQFVSELASKYSDRNKFPTLCYIPVTRRHGPAAARNAGWRAAQAPIVAFTDDDCEPTADWLKNGLVEFDNDVDAVWGRIVMPLPAVPTDYERDASGLEKAEFVTANCFCRRTTLLTIGGLDERFRLAWREDADLYFSLLTHGAVIKHAPSAVVVHPVRPARWGVSIWQQRKILFDALLYKKHPNLYREKIRPSPPWRYYLMAFALIAGVIALLIKQYPLAWTALSVWLIAVGRFTWLRLQNTSRRPNHILEMATTSVVIPLLAIFWRLYGAWRFRVWFI